MCAFSSFSPTVQISSMHYREQRPEVPVVYSQSGMGLNTEQ